MWVCCVVWVCGVCICGCVECVVVCGVCSVGVWVECAYVGVLSVV